MTEKILLLTPVSPDGTLPRVAREALAAALRLRGDLDGAPLEVGLWGADVSRSVAELQACGADRILAAVDPELAVSRGASDAVAAESLLRASAATVGIAPLTSRTARALPATALRLGGRLETHVVGLEAAGGQVTVRRWYYRQRMQAELSRSTRPWLLAIEPGTFDAWTGEPGAASPEAVPVSVPASCLRTTVEGERASGSGPQTIRPEADLLFVAGAGWTKTQADGQVHGKEAEERILGFLERSGASLGGSKSLVEQGGDGEPVLSFMSHLNQVGQTGASPRHPKGLATCCHGEEPHVVGWRFVRERRAVNTDPNCGWARGKADVVYVADAFEVMAKVNALLAERRG
ncbi:MAG: electron transfer flavoprotein subunit alpha [Acidobacteriota bacterium]|jgi:electron transfer flavoprotein alpha subunit